MINWLRNFFAAPQLAPSAGIHSGEDLPAADAAPKFTKGEYESAALRALRGRLGFLNETHGTIFGTSQSVLDAERAEIAKLRALADELQDRKYAKAIYGWLDYAEHGASSYEREMRTGEGRKGMEEYRRELDEEASRTSEVYARLPKL